MREDENTSAKTPADEEKDEIGEILNEVRQRQARESGREPSVKENTAPVQNAPAKAPEQTTKPGQDAHVPQPESQPQPGTVQQNETAPQSAADGQQAYFTVGQPQSDAGEPVRDFAEAREEEDLYPEERPMHSNKKKKIIIICACVVAVAAIAVGLFFGLRAMREPETTAPTVTQTQPVTEAPVLNPLTGEEGYNAAAVGKRPVACVIENSKSARPQWGITTPDMIVEGEVEGGATRMLWFYSDFTALPDQIGPVRSARPSFVEFSELFDAVFVHWGGSHSRENYTGGYETIEADDVDNLDGISSSGAFGRDRSRGGAVEHSGVLYGSKLVDAIESKDYRTDLDKSSYSQFSFRTEPAAVGTDPCNTLTIEISSNCAEDKVLQYDADSARYINTGSYGTQVSFKNVLVLYMDTTYKTVSYKGGTETYVDYDVAGTGSGQYASEGTITTIQWAIEDGKLELLDAQGNTLQLNPGDIYLALASANHGGEATTA